ncbi:MAG: hypothetical protein MUC81_13725 [Bacteroidia bacterium]|nr:hypothetical protein [Bacteroidia bacterium]
MSSPLNAQPFTGTNNKKASKFFGEGLKAYTSMDIIKAKGFIEKAIEADTGFIDAYMLLADIEEYNEEPEKAAKPTEEPAFPASVDIGDFGSDDPVERADQPHI